MRQRIAAVTAAAALAVAGNVAVAVAGNVARAGASPAGVASAGTAQAAPLCTITGFTPNTVVVGIGPVVRNFGIRTSGCTRTMWSVMIGNFDGYASSISPHDTFFAFRNSDAGSYRVVATAYNSAWLPRKRTWANGFHLKRANGWGRTFNASPEPVRKGRALTVQGKLSMANWDTDRYEGHGSQLVRVQFRTPTGRFATVKTIKTNAYGWAKTKVTARRTGVWRLVYSGNSISGPAISSGDPVKVI